MVASVSLSVPIWLSLNQNRIRDVLVDSAFQKFWIGHEDVVADQLRLRAELARQDFSIPPNRLLPADPPTTLSDIS